MQKVEINAKDFRKKILNHEKIFVWVLSFSGFIQVSKRSVFRSLTHQRRKTPKDCLWFVAHSSDCGRKLYIS